MKRPFSVQGFWWRRVLGQIPDIVNGGPDKCLLRARGSGVSPPPGKFWNLGPGMGDFQHLILRDNCRLFHAFYTISIFSYFRHTFCPLKFCIGNCICLNVLQSNLGVLSSHSIPTPRNSTLQGLITVSQLIPVLEAGGALKYSHIATPTPLGWDTCPSQVASLASALSPSLIFCQVFLKV